MDRSRTRSPLRPALTRLGLRALFVSRYFTTTVPAQVALLLLGLTRLRLPARMLGYVFVCAVYVGVVLIMNPAHAPISNFIFYFSFMPPFLVMVATRPAGSQEFLSHRTMLVVLALTAADGVAMNTGLRQYMWFLPLDHPHTQSQFFGFYSRPSGVAAITSSSGALAVFMLVLSDLWHPLESLANRRMITTFLTLMLLQSGTGFAMFASYVLLRVVQQHRSRIRARFAGMFVLACVAATLYAARGVDSQRAAEVRFSFEYARQTYENKVRQFERSSFGRTDTLWLGAQIDPSLEGNITSSDFGLLGMVSGIGIVGTALILLPPLLFWPGRRSFVMPVLFFYACFLHYPALASPPGAVVYGAFLWILWSARGAARSPTRAQANDLKPAGGAEGA